MQKPNKNYNPTQQHYISQFLSRNLRLIIFKQTKENLIIHLIEAFLSNETLLLDFQIMSRNQNFLEKTANRVCFFLNNRNPSIFMTLLISSFQTLFQIKDEIERCIKKYMNLEQTITYIHEKYHIHHVITSASK